MNHSQTRAFSQRDSEMKSSRITSEELKQIQEEHARKEAEKSQLRKDRAKQKMEEIKQREQDEATPKARSALAARWEEKIKARTGGKVSTTENKTTVLSDVSSVMFHRSVGSQVHIVVNDNMVLPKLVLLTNLRLNYTLVLA